MRKSLLLAVVPMVFAGSAFAQTAATPVDHQLSSSDRQFLTYAAQDNQGEIRLCLLAEDKSHAPAVEAFCRLMVVDHTEMENMVAGVAATAGMATTNSIGQEDQQKLSQMEPLNGTQFDSSFMQAQVSDHKNDIAKFQQEISSTQNPAVRRLALTGLPVLEQHLALAQAVKQSLQNGEAEQQSSTQ